MNELQKQTGHLNIQEMNKKDIGKQATSIAQEIAEEGAINSLNLLVEIKKWQEFLKVLEVAIRPMAYDEARLTDREKITIYGVELTAGEIGTKYDFSTCGCSEWAAITKRLAESKEELKERENYLKTITGKIKAANTDTGEVLHPALKTSTSGLKLTIK